MLFVPIIVKIKNKKGEIKMETFIKDFLKSKNVLDNIFKHDFDFTDLQNKINNYIHEHNIIEEVKNNTIFKYIPLPGFDKSEINVIVKNNSINIEASNNTIYCKNTKYSFTFNDNVYELVNVTLDKGILTLQLDKKIAKSEPGYRFEVK